MIVGINRNSQISQTTTSESTRHRVDPDLKVDLTTPYIHNFSINGNKITKTDPFDTLYSQLVINEPVPKTGKFTFKWKILKSYYFMNSSIFFGITLSQFKNYRTSHFHEKVYSIFGHKSLVFPNKRQERFQYGQGDIIQITVDNQDKSITYQVHKINQTTQTLKMVYPKLNLSANYLPFIQVLEPNDTVQWLGSWRH